MKSLNIFLFTCLNVLLSYAQPTATITGNTTVCQFTPTTVTFTGSNGAPPYTFTYKINGSAPQTITTTTGNSVALNLQNTASGNFMYTLVSVQDGLDASSTLSSNVNVTVNALPFVSAGLDQVVCEGFYVTLVGSGATAYTWNNSVMNGVAFLPPIGTTIYTVTGVSYMGCSNTDQVVVTNSSIPLDPGAIIDTAYCNNGSISIIQSVITSGYTYSWSNGITTPILTNVPAGTYTCNIFNSFGCYSQFNYVVPNTALPTNCAQINGSVHFDNDANCTLGSGDYPVSNRLIKATPGDFYAMSDQSGNYSFQLPAGNYTVTEVFTSNDYGSACNLSHSVNLATSTDISNNNDFMDTINGVIDFQAELYTSNVQPGFSCYLFPYFTSINITGSLLNAEAWFTIPAGVTLQSWSYPHTISNDTIHFTINTPQWFYSSVVLSASSTLSLGSSLTFSAGILPNATEVITNNNTVNHTAIVTGSFDPNDKTTFVNGVQNDSTLLLSEQKLEYLIRFQNTGTAPAQNIHILDTIQSTLNLGSFELVASSHPCTVSFLDGNVLKFNFEGIMLPDSSSNQPLSHGFVQYNINQSPQNVIGDVIRNTAYIYFDFNAPVVTNTTEDELVVSSLGFNEYSLEDIIISPNPSESYINVVSLNTIESIELTDLNGKTVYSKNQIESKVLSIDLSNYNSGVYLVKIQTEIGQVLRRVIVE